MDKTIRQSMVDALIGNRLTAKDLSKELHIMEKEVFGHLEHVIKSTANDLRFVAFPSKCLHCGFVFKKRTRLRTPSRCPVCRSEEITETEYMLEPLHGER
ncbi:MAG: transcriptional regulator, partial [Thermodesulfobacteriota bacterium]